MIDRARSARDERLTKLVIRSVLAVIKTGQSILTIFTDKAPNTLVILYALQGLLYINSTSLRRGCISNPIDRPHDITLVCRSPVSGTIETRHP